MTIVAGFVGKGVKVGGIFDRDKPYIVLAADSEESGQVLKSSVRKVAVVDKGDDCRCLIAGAGNGSFIDFAIQEIEASLSAPFSLAGVRQKIEDVVTQIHEKRIQRHPVQQRDMLSFELLCGIYVRGEGVRLVHVGWSYSLDLNEPRTIGFGEHLARYLIATYWVPTIDMYHATRLATYLLSQAKKHVMFCGGTSQVIVLTGDGAVVEVPQETLLEHERSNATVMDVAARGLLYLADPMGWGYNLSTVDSTVDGIAGAIKQSIRNAYPNLTQTVATPTPPPEATPQPEPESPTGKPLPPASTDGP